MEGDRPDQELTEDEIDRQLYELMAQNELVTEDLDNPSPTRADDANHTNVSDETCPPEVPSEQIKCPIDAKGTAADIGISAVESAPRAPESSLAVKEQADGKVPVIAKPTLGKKRQLNMAVTTKKQPEEVKATLEEGNMSSPGDAQATTTGCKTVISKQSTPNSPEEPKTSLARESSATVDESPVADRNAKAPAQAQAKKAGPPQKGANTAYSKFCAENEPQLQELHPEWSRSQIMTQLAKMWKAAAPEEKLKYEAQRTQKSKALGKTATSARKTKEKAEKVAKPAKAKTAFMHFCAENRSELKEKNPEASFAELSKLQAAAWKELPEEDRAIYIAMHQEEAAKLKAALGLVSLIGETSSGRARTGPGRKSKKEKSLESEKCAKGKSLQQGTSTVKEEGMTCPDGDTLVKDVDGSDGQEQACSPDNKRQPGNRQSSRRNAERHEDAESESDDEKERMECNWVEHPAEYIIGETSTRKFIVKRKGLDCTEYGLVDGSVAKRQRLATDDGTKVFSPVTLDMVEDYEAFVKSFKRTVHHCKDEKGVLELDELDQESALELCSFLGSMRQPNYPLEKPMKDMGDGWIRVPVLGLSMLVQRICSEDRRKRIEAEAKLKALQNVHATGMEE